MKLRKSYKSTVQPLHSAFFMSKNKTAPKAGAFFLPERGVSNVKKMEFSKKLLIADYSIFGILLVVFLIMSRMQFSTTDIVIVIGAWVAQLALSTGCYYWKAKSENLVKLPIALLKDLPEDMREKADPNQIISAVLGIGTSNN